jgi:hypothetical protein
MPDPANGGRRYRVHGSGLFAQTLKRIYRQAAQQGRADEVLSAFRRIAQQLQRNPRRLGEPLYRLPGLRMQVRSVAFRPLVVDFGVCEDRPIVFLRAVKLLSRRKP